MNATLIAIRWCLALRRFFTLRPLLAGRAARARTSVVLVLFFVVATGTARAEVLSATTREGDVTVVVEASKAMVQVAEPVTVAWKIDAPQGVAIAFPNVSSQLGDWDVIDVQDRFDLPRGDRRTWIRTLVMETIETGDVEIPSLPLSIAGEASASASASIESDRLVVRIVSVLEDRADPLKYRDIADVVDVPLPMQRSYGWLMGSVAAVATAVAVLAIGIALMGRRKRISATRWAIAELNELQHSGALQSVETDRVLARLSSILREYLELQFGVPARRQTTDEVRAQVCELNRFSDEDLTRVATVLAMADESKFASLRLTREQLETLLSDVRATVESTGAVK